MGVLVIDVGGTSVKILVSGQTEPRKFLSGPTMTPAQTVSEVKKLAGKWKYDVVSIGYPGLIHKGRAVSEPHNLGPKWVGFDFEAAFGCPVKLINDAAMQALGSYKEGILLFLGLGTGLGSALVVEGKVVPMELAHLSYKKGTFEDYIGNSGLKRHGRKKWQEDVFFVVARLIAAIHPDDVVIGGGNVNKLDKLPPGCRAGDNANAFVGGFRLWEEDDCRQVSPYSAFNPGGNICSHLQHDDCLRYETAVDEIPDFHRRLKTLTQREYEVLLQVVSGLLNRQIADNLNITEHTVKVHRGRVMQKLGVRSLASLVRVAEKAKISPWHSYGI